MLPSGAQRASSHRRTALALIVGGAAVLTLAPSASAAGPQPRQALTTIEPTSSQTAATTTTYSAPWLGVEKYALFLVNCTRTGGWVLSDGSCRGYGSGRYSAYRRPLSLSSNMSNKVSRPYARLLATRGLCTHYADHDPGYRLRRAGYRNYTWGENIGCGDGYSSAKSSVLASHRRMQAEKSTGGGHWRNIKNSSFVWIGIGVWRYGSRTRFVTDFYRPS